MQKFKEDDAYYSWQDIKSCIGKFINKENDVDKFIKYVESNFYTYGSAEERFWTKVDKKSDDECWEWIAGRDNAGYGNILYNGYVMKSHRVSYILHNGEIPEGLHILHACDNPPCVNPSHLSAGTHKENMEDKTRKGRCRGGAPIGEINGSSKVTQALVDTMRADYAENKRLFKVIAEEYGISASQARRIIKMESWNYESKY